MLAILSLLFVYISSAVIDGFTGLIKGVPAFLTEAIQRLQDWAGALSLNLPPEIQKQVDGAIQNIGVTLVNAVRGIFLRGAAFIPATIGFILGFAALPLFLFYLLKDWEKLSHTFYSAFPTTVAAHLGYIVSIIGGVMGSYIRAQVVLVLVVGVVDFIGLSILGISYAPALAVLAAITEAIPTVGPLFAGIIAVIVTLATDPSKTVWVAVLFTGVQGSPGGQPACAQNSRRLFPHPLGIAPRLDGGSSPFCRILGASLNRPGYRHYGTNLQIRKACRKVRGR